MTLRADRAGAVRLSLVAVGLAVITVWICVACLADQFRWEDHHAD